MNPFFSSSGLQRLKSEIDLVSIIGKKVKLKKSGNSFIGHCPYHEDTRPSLMVSPGKNLWCCMGACNKGGSIVDWVMQSENLPVGKALSALAFRYPQYLSVEDSKIKNVKTISLTQFLFKNVINFYHLQLRNNTEALQYLAGRKISDEAIEYFQIGYCEGSLQEELNNDKSTTVEEKTKILEKLKEMNIVIPNSRLDKIIERFKGSIIIPLFDQFGNVVQIYARKVNPKKESSKHRYLRGKLKGIFNIQYLSQTMEKEIILCESIIDAMSFWNNGYKNVTCSFGVNGFTDELFNFLLEKQIRKVYIAYDHDEAGEKGAERLNQKLSAHNIQCFRVPLPPHRDVNAYMQIVEIPRRTLEIIMHRAYPMDSVA